MGVQRHASAVLPSFPGKRPGTHCTGGWLCRRALLEECGESRPNRDSLPESSTRSVSLYRQSYRGPLTSVYWRNNSSKESSVEKGLKTFPPMTKKNLSGPECSQDRGFTITLRHTDTRWDFSGRVISPQIPLPVNTQHNTTLTKTNIQVPINYACLFICQAFLFVHSYRTGVHKSWSSGRPGE